MEQLSNNDKNIRDTGRQLGQAEGTTAKFLDIILEDPTTQSIAKWQQLILNFSRNSCDLRDDFGQKAIASVVEKQKVNRCIILFLCCFAHDVWGRKSLKEEGALSIILER